MLKPSDIGHISIHAPLTGSDLRRRTGMNTFVYFNPRSPHRERRSICSNRLTLVIFQSTLPSQGATNAFMMPTSSIAISIHAPLTGSDRSIARSSFTIFLFQSTLPSQGATGCNPKFFFQNSLFQSTLPSQGAT